MGRQRSIQDVFGPYYTTFTLLCYTKRRIMYRLATPVLHMINTTAYQLSGRLVYGKEGGSDSELPTRESNGCPQRVIHTFQKARKA